MILGIGTGIIALALIVFHVPPQEVGPLLVVALPLIIIWLLYDRMQEQKKKRSMILGKSQNLCRCHICKHTTIGDCIKARCSCCMIIKKDNVMDHEVI